MVDKWVNFIARNISDDEYGLLLKSSIYGEEKCEAIIIEWHIFFILYGLAAGLSTLE